MKYNQIFQSWNYYSTVGYQASGYSLRPDLDDVPQDPDPLRCVNEMPTRQMSINFNLRPAKKTDQHTIYKLVLGAYLNPTGLDWRRFVVATTTKGEVIACGQIKHHRDGSYELASLVVNPSWRGQGVARLILEHLIQNHNGDLYLICRNIMGNFYGKYGFKLLPEPEMPKYFRKISKIASITKALQKDGPWLLIMCREGCPEGNKT